MNDGAHGAILLRLPEAAATLGIGRSMLYRLLEAGELASVRVGRRRLVPRAELERYADQLTAKARTEGQR